MKKIVMGLAALVMAASVFAVDFSSTVKMNTTIAAKNGDDVDFLKLNKENQKDGDALIVSGATDRAGGQFQLWYTYDGTNGENSYKDVTKAEAGTSAGPWEDGNVLAFHGLRIRNVNIWFKPIDALKITVGDINLDSYKEHTFWWHGVYGAKPGSWGAFGGEYIGGNGAKLEYNLDAVSITAAIFPGAGNAFFSTKENYGYKPYGLKVRYGFGGGSAAFVFADKGKDADKIIAAGAEYSGIDNLYFFVNFNARINDGLQGISLDNWVQYAADGLTIQARLPFVMFKDGDKMVPGLYATFKVSYALDGFTPYFLATTEPDGDKGWILNDSFEFDMTFKPGVNFNCGPVGFDFAFRLDVDQNKAADKTDINWSVPLTFSIGL